MTASTRQTTGNLTPLDAAVHDPRPHAGHALLYGPILRALVGASDLAVPADELTKRLKQIEDRPLHFRVEGVDGPYFMPYWLIEHELFTCFPTLR